MSTAAREDRRYGEGAKPAAEELGWKGIFWGLYQSVEEDRVLAVAAGVTFYGLLAIFPAVGAIVSLYGLFADGATIRDNLSLLSSVLPSGALEIIGDQIQRVASAGGGTLGFSFLLGLAIAIWGAMPALKPYSMRSTLHTVRRKNEAFSS